MRREYLTARYMFGLLILINIGYIIYAGNGSSIILLFFYFPVATIPFSIGSPKSNVNESYMRVYFWTMNAILALELIGLFVMTVILQDVTGTSIFQSLVLLLSILGGVSSLICIMNVNWEIKKIRTEIFSVVGLSVLGLFVADLGVFGIIYTILLIIWSSKVLYTLYIQNT